MMAHETQYTITVALILFLLLMACVFFNNNPIQAPTHTALQSVYKTIPMVQACKIK